MANLQKKSTPFTKHFEARKEILENWIKTMGFKRSIFRFYFT
ncbi:MAG: hypothetical protein ACTSSH_09275 [Candidatus Heimdallarchaeota archaeon]